MARTLPVLPILALLAALLPASLALAQAPKSSPDSGAVATPDPLPGLPQPLDTPRSLMQPEQPLGPHGDTPEQPYFELNPYLDPPQLPQPGWLADVQLGGLDPHFKNKLSETVTTSDGTTATVHAPGAALDWAFAGRVEAGYRIPSGWGELALSYRFFNTSGSEAGVGEDGAAALSSRLDVNIIDLDYASREFSLWPHWDMKWRLGVRTAFVYYDSQAQESAAVAATGSGLPFQRNTNNFTGAGPHASVELARHFEDSGLAFITKVDAASIIGQLSQDFFAQSLAGGTGQTIDRATQDVPVLHWDIGLSWQPPNWKNVQISAGYEYEYWWNVGRFSNGVSRADMSDSGLFLRAAINY
jgi:hypothetical protein